MNKSTNETVALLDEGVLALANRFLSELSLMSIVTLATKLGGRREFQSCCGEIQPRANDSTTPLVRHCSAAQELESTVSKNIGNNWTETVVTPYNDDSLYLVAGAGSHKSYVIISGLKQHYGRLVSLLLLYRIIYDHKMFLGCTEKDSQSDVEFQMFATDPHELYSFLVEHMMLEPSGLIQKQNEIEDYTVVFSIKNPQSDLGWVGVRVEKIV